MPPNEEVLDVQNAVLEDEIKEQHLNDSEKKMFSFIIENAPIFRLFSMNLSQEEREIWDRFAKGELKALSELEDHYDPFREDLEEFISQIDEDTMSEFSKAIDEGNIDEASQIVEACARLRRTVNEKDGDESAKYNTEFNDSKNESERNKS